MKNDLKKLVIESGANTVIYERNDMTNVEIDHHVGMIGIIKEITSIELPEEGNGIGEEVNLSVSFVKQVEYSDKADNNATVMNACLTACKSLLMKIIYDSKYTLSNKASVTKVPERRYDSNVIGWELGVKVKLRDGYIEC